jgi:aldose sugar dehydrogenase
MSSLRKSSVSWVIAAVAAGWIAVGLTACGGGGGGGQTTSVVLEPFLANASFPSAIRFTPDGRLFYAELTTGKIRVVDNGQLLAQEFAALSVSTATEKGLLGLAIDPDFTNNHYVYAFYTLADGNSQRVVRFTEASNVGTNQTTIVDALPTGVRHNGGRIGFGADGKLYVTLGDNADPANSQNVSVLPGKLLRYNSDGSIPADNPNPASPVYALGLRNPFGLAFYPGTGTPYVSENGPNCDDEVDRIVASGNYGWRPGQACGDVDPGFRQPTRRYSSIIAPTGVTFYTGNAFPQFQNDLIMASFSDGSVRRLSITDSGTGLVTSEQVLTSALGNALDVAIGPDGLIYVATANSIQRLAPAP